MSDGSLFGIGSMLDSLKSFWSRTTQTTAAESAVSHACLSNLIIYTEDILEEKHLTETIGEFVNKHPCRVILILAQPANRAAKLEASVVTHESKVGAHHVVSCEQITLRVQGSGLEELPSAIQALLVPDLPIYLWWRGIFLHQRKLLESLLPFVTRFIYDGVTWTQLHHTVPEVSRYFEQFADKVAFTNFNWSRLRPWREHTADFFDPGAFEMDLPHLNRVRVEYMSVPGMEEGYQFRALLYVGWLAAQLEWEPAGSVPDRDTARLQFRNPKGIVIETELALIPQSTTTSQSIQRIVLGTQQGGKAQEFLIERDHRQHMMVLSTKIDETNATFRTVPHADSSNADLLYRELGRRIRNRVFEKAFKMAARLIQTI